MIDLSGEAAKERFWSRVDVGGVCWEWTGHRSPKGYGQTTIRPAAGTKVTTGSHRRAYILLVGEIPDGMTLDHLCRNKPCVNPDHLEVVTRAENAARATFPTERCRNGHAYTPIDTLPTQSAPGKNTKRCRQCLLVRAHRKRGIDCSYESLCDRISHRERGEKTVCARGHSMADAYVRRDNGKRQCRACRALRSKK